jgi:hypothetical protein
MNIKGRVMNYSLLSADYRTHFKIIALAVFASAALGFAAYGSNISSANGSAPNLAHVMAKSHMPKSQSSARAENISVCRFNAL